MAIRHTKTRQWTLRAVKLSPRALTAEEVFAAVKRRCPEAGLATVYRNLEFFARRGELYRVEGDDGVKRYIGHSFHQVLFRCQRCGKIRELPSVSLQAYVNRKMWGRQTVFFSRLTAQGLCGSCVRVVKSHHPARFIPPNDGMARRPSSRRRGE